MDKVQKEVAQAHLNNEKAVLKQLEENYKTALAEINDKIKILSARDDADMQQVIYQIQYQEALKGQVEAALKNLQNNNFDSISEYLNQSYTDGFIGTVYDINKKGIPIMLPIDEKQMIDAIINQSKLSKDLYASLNLKQLKNQISEAISSGISAGMMWKDIAARVDSIAHIGLSNAMRIARTEGHRISNRAAYDAGVLGKSKGADLVKQWDATLDGRTRPHHNDLDGQVREIEEPFEVAGKEAMFAGAFGDPSEDCNCRCTVLNLPRSSVDGRFTKWNGFTRDLQEFENLDSYKNFKKEYWKKYEEQKNKSTESLEKETKSSKILSGAISGARNPFGGKAKEHAARYYGLVRSMNTDVAKISRATGFSEKDIQDIKDFIFYEKHDLGSGEFERFEPDYMMAESWRRLIEGKHEKHDITMLNHELLERDLMQKGMSQEMAHIEASKKHNYSKEAGEFYAKIDKYKKE